MNNSHSRSFSDYSVRCVNESFRWFVPSSPPSSFSHILITLLLASPCSHQATHAGARIRVPDSSSVRKRSLRKRRTTRILPLLPHYPRHDRPLYRRSVLDLRSMQDPLEPVKHLFTYDTRVSGSSCRRCRRCSHHTARRRQDTASNERIKYRCGN